MDWKEFSLGLLANWKTLVTIAGLLGTTSFTGCQWSNAETRAENEKQAAMYLASNMLNTTNGAKPAASIQTGCPVLHDEITGRILDKLNICVNHVINH